MAEPRRRIRVPRKAKKGELILIRTLISHPMESGLRKDKTGQIIPRKIIKRFVCKLNGREVFRTELHPAIAANPYLTFKVKVMESGTFEFIWIDDDGSVYTKTAKIEVS